MQSALMIFQPEMFSKTSFSSLLKQPSSRNLSHLTRRPNPVVFERMLIVVDIQLLSELRKLIATKLVDFVDSYTVKSINHSKRLKVCLRVIAGTSDEIMCTVMKSLNAAEFGYIKKDF